MLAYDVFGDGSRNALDFTVGSDRAVTRQEALESGIESARYQAALLDGVEHEKLKYEKTYGTIGIQVMGLAMDLAGGLGPNVKRLLQRCDTLRKGVPPAWANWSSGSSFKAAWTQKFIITVQVSNVVVALRNKMRSAASRAKAGPRGQIQYEG